MSDEDITENALYKKGLQHMAKHLGTTLTNHQVDTFSKINKTLKDSLVLTFGLFYDPKTQHLSEKEKELCVVAVLTASGNIPELKTHFQAAIRCGASQDEAIEAIVQTIPYTGFPQSTHRN